MSKIPFDLDFEQAIYDWMKAFIKMNKANRRRYLNNSIKKIKLARRYILRKQIPLTNAFEESIPWPKELRYDRKKCSTERNSILHFIPFTWHVSKDIIYQFVITKSMKTRFKWKEIKLQKIQMSLQPKVLMILCLGMHQGVNIQQ